MDPEIERNILIISKRYLKTVAVFDILANFPILVYNIVEGYPQSRAEIETVN